MRCVPAIADGILLARYACPMPHLQPVPLKLALRNTADIELWPASLLRAHGNAHARLLARARRV